MSDTITDLIYDSAFVKEILIEYPGAEIEDASDIIHDSRVGVTVSASVKEWYAFLFKHGAHGISLSAQMTLRMPRGDNAMAMAEALEEDDGDGDDVLSAKMDDLAKSLRTAAAKHDN